MYVYITDECSNPDPDQEAEYDDYGDYMEEKQNCNNTVPEMDMNDSKRLVECTKCILID